MDENKLFFWVDELGKLRKELPYELVQVFSTSDKDALKTAVDVAYGHIERVLGFRHFLEYEDEEWGLDDLDDIWIDLVTLLDDRSYYAALAVPLLRRVLEIDVDFIFKKVDAKYRDQWSNQIFSVNQIDLYINQKPIFKATLEYLHGNQKQIFKAALNLASKFSALNKWYRSLSSPAELAEWGRYFLYCSTELINLPLRYSLLDE
jgi:hypothetical protein